MLHALQVQPSLAAASFDPFAAQKRAGWIKSLPAAVSGCQEDYGPVAAFCFWCADMR
jgi:hypothetical protein